MNTSPDHRPKGFQIPENYFEDFSRNLNSKLEEITQEDTQEINIFSEQEKQKQLGFTRPDFYKGIDIDQVLTQAKKIEDPKTEAQIIQIGKFNTFIKYFSSIAAALLIGYGLFFLDSKDVSQVAINQMHFNKNNFISQNQDQLISSLLDEEDILTLDHEIWLDDISI